MKTKHKAFTLVELLVVIAIIGMLVGLLLPAVQTAREAARKMSCSNNMRQIALGMLNYESAMKTLPPAYSNSTCKNLDFGKENYGNHNGLIFILPYIEQQQVYDQFDLSKNWNDTSTNTKSSISNQEAAQVQISAFLCPSAGTLNDTNNVRIFAGDYTANQALQVAAIQAAKNANSTLTHEVKQYRSALMEFRKSGTTGVYPTKLADVSDGLSNSMLYFEDAGRPFRYKYGKHDGTDLGDAPWADPNQTYGVDYFPFQNVTNNNETYSFHANGCTYSFCDGSVHFMTDSMDPDTYISLFTHNEGDSIGASVE